MWRQKLSGSYDIAVVGSGFSGSLMAMIARQLGHSVVLIEKGTHPRVVIGESSTPLSNLLLEELATRYDLPALRPLAKWGSWQRAYPDVGCGLKRGFTFHHHVPGVTRADDPNRQDQLLVAASPRDAIADTHWYRADFDHLLVREAQKLGVLYFDKTNLQRFCDHGSEIALEGECNGQDVQFRAKFVVDATGPRGFLHRVLQLGERKLSGYPETQALYSHFSGVRRLGDTEYSRTAKAPPYPVDDAAVHHVFDGGWIWVLQFSNGMASAGVAATNEFAARLCFHEGESAWGRILDLIPALKEQFAESKAERTFTHTPRLSFRSAQMAGHRWVQLPSAAGFVDPLLSTGFPLALLGVERLAQIIEQDWEADRLSARLEEYSARTDAELVATARLIGALYANMSNFPVFVALSLLYFAAVSYSEAARRLGNAHLASSFLLCGHPEFGPRAGRLLDRARLPFTQVESAALIREILAAIEPFDIAGLGRPERRNWYPVDADDLFNGADKLGATHDEISDMLRRCGFHAKHTLACD
ncbi:MAG TPA: FAD-dependent oxidoreductase [Acidobacteriaceae bacterium]|jgi:FADH2 O2-dependent halogenase|nr:FAD-dependent oxidoreductase [Acidobacteriaceae bacterium]